MQEAVIIVGQPAELRGIKKQQGTYDPDAEQRGIP